ncbi:hypothetical protein FGO68_gene5404 [Halteria grandinella]|uniref:Fibronectin type-I domain-containing protein n=1 Tax=Halteria grandinella TaxID=5974 RepID=A0A8J8SUC3_HALGN|nr:hypothetical protein FGO68_gene5404 [Halteria grandinella]
MKVRHSQILDNGRIELHELQDTNDASCSPISNHQHFEQQEQFAKLNCSNCKMEKCCCVNKNLNACCLACNGGHCGEKPQASSKLLHFHGPNCGHPIVLHNGHIDYLVNEVLHYPHDGHCDHHGVLNRIMVQ